jgi:hypothetical protein
MEFAANQMVSHYRLVEKCVFRTNAITQAEGKKIQRCSAPMSDRHRRTR